MSDFVPTAAQLEAINSRDSEVAVSAAAGSGKTSVLVQRVICAALGQGLDAEGRSVELPGGVLPLDRLMVATFTNAAAAELRARLHEGLARELQKGIAAGADVRLLREQLSLLPLASIGTLHGFCLELLRRYGHERGINASRVLSEHESRLLLHERSSRFLDEQLGRSDPELQRLGLDWGGQDGVGSEDLSRVHGGRGLRSLLLEVYELKRSLADSESWYKEHLDWPELDPMRFDPQHPAVAALCQDWDERIAALARADAQLLPDLAGLDPKEAYPDILARRAGPLGQARLSLGWNELGEFIRGQLEARQDTLHYKPTLLGKNYRSQVIDQPELLERIMANKQQAQELFAEISASVSRPWARVAADENHVRGQLRLLWRLATEFEALLDSHKRERGWLDYSDMERGALELLSARDEAGQPLRDAWGKLQPSRVAQELRTRFQAILVDEYQDTNPLQADLIELISAELPLPGGAGTFRPRFVVGDVKQSIYSFRLAEPALFVELQTRLGAQEASGRAGARLIRLQENFRSRHGVVGAINYLLQGLMTEELGGEDYARAALVYSADYPQDEAEAQAPLMRLSLVSLAALRAPEAAVESGAGEAAGAVEGAGPGGEGEPSNEQEGEGDDEQPELSRAVYRAVARRLLELHADGVAWGDMVILLRSIKGRVEALREELERAQIPCLALGRSGFYERPEVLDALSLLRVIENPLSDIALAAVLRGPALGLSPEQLLITARPDVFAPVPEDRAALDVMPAPYLEDQAAGSKAAPGSREPLWARLLYSAQHSPDGRLRQLLQDFLARLDQWRELARDEPLRQLLERLYSEAGLLAAAAAQSRAGQRRSNLKELLRLAGEFSSFERQGVSRFLQFIESSRMAAGDSGEAVEAGTSVQQVRIMSVHQAKGLEFPVVILPDLHRKFNEQDINSADLLWHYRAGIGGRFYDIAGRPPRRATTLALERIRRARRRDLLSEELRLLYVALTRARERLELVSGLPPGFNLGRARTQEPGASHCWLDWLASRLGPQMQQAIEQGAALVSTDVPLIEICRQSNPGMDMMPERTANPGPPSQELGSEQTDWLIEMLSWRYPAGDIVLPGKIAVSRLAHAAALPGAAIAVDEDREVLLSAFAFEADSAALDDAPGFSFAPPLLLRPSGTAEAAQEPQPREVGTATHRLLAELDPLAADFTSYAEMQVLEQLRRRLLAAGQLEPAAAAQIRLDQVAAYVLDCSRHAASFRQNPGAICRREQPLGLLVPAAEVAAALGIVTEQQLVSEGQVYVQGTVDLLLIGDGEVLVLDYKTDRGSSAAGLRERYSRQLEWYCRGVRLLLPGLNVRWAIYGLDRAGWVEPV